MKINDVKEMTIIEFFEMCENNNGEYQIDTPDGWQDINFLVKKKNKKCYNLVTENGKELKCSESHQVLTNSGWKKSKDINVQNDIIKTRDGDDNIVAKEYLGIRDTFDLSVNSQEHRYYSNDIISHNCGKSLISKVIANVWNMPLLKLDFGKLFGSLVGDSEKNARTAIRLAEEVAPCVTYDTIIQLENGQDQIGKIYDNINSKNIKEVNEDTFIAVLSEPINIQSFDVKKEKTISSKLRAIIKRNIGVKKVYQVTLKSGKIIKVSEDHKFLIYKDGEKIWKKIKEIKEKDLIITL